MRSPQGQKVFYAVLLLCIIAAVAFLAMRNPGSNGFQTALAQLAPQSKAIDGERSYGYLKDICAIGRRVSGTEGMQQQQQMLQAHFRKLGGQVSMQEWQGRHPQSGEPVNLANMIITWHPERKDRIVLCAHYDTRPFPDSDPQNPRGMFLGANDGASGVALLMELAHTMPDLQSRYGVDFVLFDAEELIFNPSRDKYFLGSEHFAREYRDRPPQHKYHYGVLLDMVADRELQLYQEINSMRWPDTRPLVRDIWATAKKMRVREFIERKRHEVRDDHLALRNIAGIPTCDIIDFDYPRPGRVNYWHTEKDVPENCSAESLQKVGSVLHTWLQKVDRTLPPR